MESVDQMETIVKRSILSLTVLAAVLAANGAGAEPRVEAGTLVCHGSKASGFIVGSEQKLDCTFRPILGPEQKYAGVIRRAGLDIGRTKHAALVWMILAPTRELKDGELAGDYAGVTAGATAVVGGAANILFGGSRNSFALQPLNLEGEVGLKVVAAVTGLELRRL